MTTLTYRPGFVNYHTQAERALKGNEERTRHQNHEVHGRTLHARRLCERGTQRFGVTTAATKKKRGLYIRFLFFGTS